MGTEGPAPPHAPAQTNEGGATPMIKLMRLCLWLSIFAAVIGSARAGPAIGGEGPGKGYAQVPQGAYSVVAEVRAKPGKEAELRAATLPLVALVRSDPKNLVYFLQEDREAPGHFIFYEIFADQADFD